MEAANRELYRSFSNTQPDIPLFQRAWWLDAACGPDGWNVVLCISDGAIVGALPYIITTRLGFRLIGQPMLTQFLGPWISPTGAKTARHLAREKDIMGELIAGLPRHDYYSQGWGPAITNWLPFYWQGFSQTTRYTYVIRSLSDEQALWNGMQTNIRGDVRKAESRFHIRLQADPSIDDFIAINDKTFERQGKKTPYSADFLTRLDSACAERGQRRIFIAEDERGRPHAAAYLVWDEQKAYYLAGGGDPELRNSGATSYCLWQALKFSGTVTRSFDFEGSMMEPVERFVRGFGAEQVQYFLVSRTPSRLLRLRTAIRALR